MIPRRPPRPDLDPGDRVLVVAHHWQDGPAGRVWVPTGGYRWRVVDRVVFDTWCGWQVMCQPEAPHHPSREDARHVVSALRARPADPVPVAAPVGMQLGLFEVANRDPGPTPIERRRRSRRPRYTPR